MEMWGIDLPFKTIFKSTDETISNKDFYISGITHFVLNPKCIIYRGSNNNMLEHQALVDLMKRPNDVENTPCFIVGGIFENTNEEIEIYSQNPISIKVDTNNLISIKEFIKNPQR